MLAYRQPLTAPFRVAGATAVVLLRYSMLCTVIRQCSGSGQRRWQTCRQAYSAAAPRRCLCGDCRVQTDPGASHARGRVFECDEEVYGRAALRAVQEAFATACLEGSDVEMSIFQEVFMSADAFVFSQAHLLFLFVPPLPARPVANACTSSRLLVHIQHRELDARGRAILHCSRLAIPRCILHATPHAGSEVSCVLCRLARLRTYDTFSVFHAVASCAHASSSTSMNVVYSCLSYMVLDLRGGQLGKMRALPSWCIPQAHAPVIGLPRACESSSSVSTQPSSGLSHASSAALVALAKYDCRCIAPLVGQILNLSAKPPSLQHTTQSACSIHCEPAAMDMISHLFILSVITDDFG